MLRHDAALASCKLTRGATGGQPTHRKSLCLGRRHVQYGVHPEDYGAVGAAFTPEVREAWTRAYAVLAELMTMAAGEPPPSSQPRPTGPEPRLHHM
jgi:hypothetical protein